MRFGIIAGVCAALLACPATAQTTLASASAVFVEHVTDAPGGIAARTIAPAQMLRRGDRVVLMVEWQAQNPVADITVASAVPRKLAFLDSSEESLEVSPDNGRSWGKLGELQIADAYGTRLVSPEDVTQLRWRIPRHEIAQGRKRIVYSAVVR